MASAAQPRTNTSAPGDGSRTITIHDVQPRPGSSNDDPEGSTTTPAVGVLTLRGGQRRNRRHVVWDDDVIDNEGAGKKKSKSEFAAAWLSFYISALSLSDLFCFSLLHIS